MLKLTFTIYDNSIIQMWFFKSLMKPLASFRHSYDKNVTMPDIYDIIAIKYFLYFTLIHVENLLFIFFIYLSLEILLLVMPKCFVK